MSLKLFHICFIVICCTCAIAFAAWCLLIPDLPAMFTVMGWLSLVGGVALVVYGVRFVRKAKNVIT